MGMFTLMSSNEIVIRRISITIIIVILKYVIEKQWCCFAIKDE